MTVTELLNEINKLNEEIGCNGTVTASHNSPSSVRFVLDNVELDYHLNLVSIEPNFRIGCGCWDGVIFHLETKK